MTGTLRSILARRPLLTAVVYTGTGVLPLALVSAQILQLDREIGFGVGRLGLATATFFGAAALAANPAGRVVSRLGPGTGLRIGSMLVVLACVIAGTAQVWWVLPVATAVAGVANGLIQVASNLAIFDGVALRRQGLGFGAKQAAVPLAGVLAGLSLPVVGLVFGWRWVFAIAGAIGAVLVLSAPQFAAGRAMNRREDRIGRPPRALLLLALGGICGAMAGNGLSLFIVPSAVDIGIAEAAAGAVLAVCSFLVVLVRLGAGWSVDRRQSIGLYEMAWMAGAGAVGALVLMATSTASLYLVAMPIALLGAWGWPGIFFFTVVHSFPAFPARASGLVLSSNLTGTVIGPLVVGWFAGQGDYPAAWIFVAATSAVATTAFVVSGRLRQAPTETPSGSSTT
jgi:predicted MFS family arabinose efflux permease